RSPSARHMHGERMMPDCITKQRPEQMMRDCFASLAMTADGVIGRQLLSLRGARSATKQSLPRGSGLLAQGQSRVLPRLPEPSDSNYDACQWIAGDMNSAFLENGLVREKSYVW